MNKNKKKEYIDLANQLIRKIITDENIEKMENCIKRKYECYLYKPHVLKGKREMNKMFVDTIKSCDADKYFELLNEYPYSIICCGVLEGGEENFFQRALDGNIPMRTYLHGEKEIINIVHKLYENNKNDDIVGCIGAHGNLVTDTYAKKTWGFKTRFILNLLSWKCLYIGYFGLLHKMVLVGCREMGATFLYFTEEDIFVCIDALRCVIFSKTEEQALSYIKEIKCEHEVRSLVE